jgi:hypothetical protein
MGPFCFASYPALRRWLTGALLWLLGSCITPFDPQDVGATPDYLMVEGFINSRGTTSIRLTRTAGLRAEGPPPAETGARVLVEEEQGAQYSLAESPAGTYTSAALALNPARRYRLRFTTAAGREYASAFVPVLAAPPIDTVRWAVEPRGVQLYVSTRDDVGNARHYRWELEETWQFTSAHRSQLEYVNGRIEPRQLEVYECWTTEKSSTIRLASTERLSQNVVSDLPLTLLPSNSVKLRKRYSLLVRQYAQSSEEYVYWDLLRRNTESIGTLFDPLPSELTGNVRCLTQPDERVLGYVGAGSVAEKRIFIDRFDLPVPWVMVNTGYEGCARLDTVKLSEVPGVFGGATFWPVATVTKQGVLIGYTAAAPACLDCRRRGTIIRPSFWR